MIQAQRELWNKISYRILLAITFLAPLFFIPISSITPQFGTSLLFSFGVIITVLIYLVSGLVSGSLELPHESRYILGFTALVPLVYILASVVTGFSRLAFFGYTFDVGTVGFILVGFSYLFLVSVLFKEKNRIFYSYFAFVISSVILALFVVLRIILGAKFLSFGIFTDLTATPVGTWNNLGIFFGVGAILSLLTFEMVNVSKLMKGILTIALMLSLVFLALVNFTTIWIIVGVSAFLFVLYKMFSIENFGIGTITFSDRLKTISLYPVLVMLLSIIFSIWGTSVGSWLSREFHVSNLEVRPSFSVTASIIKNTLASKPFFGSGPNTFINQWLTYRPDEIIQTVFWNTDFTNGVGLIPTFAVTTGIIGVLSWLVFLCFYLYLGLKAIFSRTDDAFTKYLLVSSFFASLFLWIMTFLYVPSSVVLILTFFFTGLFFASVYLAGLIQMENRVFSVSPRTGFIASLIFVTCIVASVALGLGLYRNLESLWYFQKSSYALNTNGDITASEKYMAKAIEGVPYDVYFRSLANIEVLKLRAVASQDPKQVSPTIIQQQFRDVLANAIKAGIAAKDADPANYLNWIALGQVYEAVSDPVLKIDGAYESAQFAYKEALTRNPKNPGILMLFARLASTHSDLKQAEDFAKQAIQEKSNYLDAYFLLSQIQVASGNIKGAIDSVAAASVIDPTNPAIFFQLGLLKYNNKDYKGAIETLEKATSMTPDYANAKYFLGLCYEATGEHEKAIGEFQDLKKTNPDSKEVDAILTNLLAGKPIFNNATTTQPEKGKNLPVKEKVQ